MTTPPERQGAIGLFCLGILFGAAAAGIGVYVWQQREVQRRDAALGDAAKALKVGQDIVGGLSPTSANPAGAAPASSVPDKIKKLGDECVEDLRLDRLLSVYRLTTKAYQLRMPREQFEVFVHKIAKLRNMATTVSARESKVRMSPDGKSCDYYCTSNLVNHSGVVNVALTFFMADGDWRIDEIELRQDG